MEQYRTREREEEKYREHEEDIESTEVNGNNCSFCGSPMDEDDNFCPECGNPRSGIICPECGTLNHGSFCSKCNAPLDDLAREAVRQAKADPRFQEAERLAAELIELEEEIERLKKEASAEGNNPSGTGLDTSPILSDQVKEALNKYNRLFADVANIQVKETQAKTPSETSANPISTESQFSIKSVTLKEAVERYKAVATQLQAKLDAMLPDAATTPQEQRNFFSARKIRSSKVVHGDRFWVCNYCGCKHHQPSECTKPWMGGKWIVDMKIEGTIDTTLYD
ncbi:MAG: zinc ribbon domain-containing protein [Muribaculaceae bacterium]|nr:zinc ribbon domain-containing protein [Muribaculaceae bacterium]